MDIGIYTTKEILEKKIWYTLQRCYQPYWRLHGLPKSIPKRLWVAVEGEWIGYFTVKSVVNNEIWLGDWARLPKSKHISRTQFQGFTYKTPIPQLAETSGALGGVL